MKIGRLFRAQHSDSARYLHCFTDAVFLNSSPARKPNIQWLVSIFRSTIFHSGGSEYIMHTLFNPENKFWNFMGKLADVACMSILWLITSLPIFTIGASTAAFYSFTLDAVQDKEGSVWSSYFSAFRKHFKKSTLIWLVQIVLFAFLLLNLYAAWNFYLMKGLLGLGFLSLAVCGMLILICTGFYLYPILVSFEFSVKKVIIDSFIMAIRNPHVTITQILLFILAGYCIYQISGLFFFWLGAAFFFCSYFIWGLFLKYAGVKVERKKKKKRPADPYI